MVAAVEDHIGVDIAGAGGHDRDRAGDQVISPQTCDEGHVADQDVQGLTGRGKSGHIAAQFGLGSVVAEAHTRHTINRFDATVSQTKESRAAHAQIDAAVAVRHGFNLGVGVGADQINGRLESFAGHVENQQLSWAAGRVPVVAVQFLAGDVQLVAHRPHPGGFR